MRYAFTKNVGYMIMKNLFITEYNIINIIYLSKHPLLNKQECVYQPCSPATGYNETSRAKDHDVECAICAAKGV